MGIFSCCFKNVVEQVVVPEEVDMVEKVSRKVTSASSKQSKDSGEWSFYFIYRGCTLVVT